MKSQIISAILFSALIPCLCFGKQYTAVAQVNAGSFNGLAFSLNGRQFAAGKADAGAFSQMRGVPELLKSGENILSVSIAEPASEAAKQTLRYANTTEKTEIKIFTCVTMDGGAVTNTAVVDETFTMFPTNIAFSVSDDWPVKKLDWVGNLPPLTDADKAEILAQIRGISDAFATLNKKESRERLLELKKVENKQTALFEGKTLVEIETRLKKAFIEVAGKYNNNEIDYSNLQYERIEGLNLVRIKDPKSPIGSKTLISVYDNDDGGAILGPEWFSKIDGKWRIVP